MRPDEQIPILPAVGSEPPPEPPAPPPPPEEPAVRHPSPRQTLSYLRGLLQSHGLEPKSKLGQNFLIDLNLLDLTCRTAELGPEDAVLEVGTGTGSLTTLMADKAGCVFSVEVDKDIQRIARYFVGDRPNVHLFFGDALARKNELRAEMLAGWTELAARHGCTRRKLVANLPYVIATPIISNLLISDIPVDRMVVMVQWEIGERMQARPGTKDYNALSVLVQALADIEIVRKVLPTNFFPKPKVDSAIIMIRPNAEKRAKVGDVPRLRVFLRDLYVHRRKNLRQALSGWPTGPKSKADVDAKLAELGIDGSIRAEALDVEQHLRLCQVFG
ncbi:16S rRNA (adenine(1518)-N(6)/adenine(1519)-N(6))-dimethyltransferase RsmA [Fimbriiglobus ruber]|nr:16S rRNA (adenine(1518)-N(6)/adenine(1519)-N(6))-dimethyltransferase RsmA [Fimbriiglobus ruber]